MAANPRIDELRKRLEKEPASRLFAQLAEELRKDGELAEAVRVCREGLQKHPNYPSARMTLGRALLDSGDFTSASSEFDTVLKAAPDNILASRFLAESYEAMGDTVRAEAQYRHTLALSPGDKQVTGRLEALAQARGASPAAPAPPAATPPPPRPPAPLPVAAPPAGTGRPAAAPPPPPVRPVPAPASAPAPARVPPPPPPMAAPAPPPPPPADPPPIPLVEADEEFELERSYEAPRPSVPAPRSTAEQALAREFELESEVEPDFAGTTLPPMPSAKVVSSEPPMPPVPPRTPAPAPAPAPPPAPVPELEVETTARFMAIDDESAATRAAGVEAVPARVEAPPAAPPPAVRRPGLETLFRFSAFDADAAAEELPPAVPAPPTPAPLPPPAPPPPAYVAAPPAAPAVAPPAAVPESPEIVSSTLAELYFSQGHIDKAVDVYRRLLRGGPENEKARTRLIELEALDRKAREEAAAAGPSREERRAAIERTITRLETMLTVLRKE